MFNTLCHCFRMGMFTVAMPLAAAVGISISPTTTTVNQGSTKQFTATVTGTTNTAVTWSVTGTGNGSITSAGLYTAPAKAGTFTVVVKSSADTTKTASATITVSAVGISLSPTTATVAQGGTQTFTATVTGAANTGVTWSVTGSGNGTITSGGVYTAPAKAGIFTVTAKSSADATKTASATVTVPVKVAVSPAAPTVNGGATQQFTATVTGGNSSSVTWSATGGSITSGGLYTAPATPGTCTVTATSVATPTGSGSATVTVPGVGITVSPTGASVAINGSKTFTATVTGSANTAKTWSCSAGSITSGGVFTAPATAGTCTVTATSAADPTKTATATVTVSPIVSISAPVTTFDQGETETFSATVDGTSNQAVTWTATAGSITGSGAFTAPTAAGSVTITATSVADPTAKATQVVSVRAITISISPKTVSLPAGNTQTFTATLAGSVNTGLTWTVASGGGSISPIPGGGNAASYLAPFTTGTATVKVASVADPTKSATATVTLTANPNPVIRSFSASPVRIAAGGSAQLTGDFGNGTGVVQPGSLALTANTPRTVSPAGTTVYSLTVTGTGGTVSQSASVNVTGPGRFLPVARTAPAMNIYDLMDARTAVDRAGRLLLVGGSPTTADGLPVERFDPATGAWTLVGRIQTNVSLTGYTLLMLPDDRLLLIGGYYVTGPTTYYYSNIVFVFDTRTGTQGANWAYGRYLRDVGAALLADGRVLLAGGYGLPPGVTWCYGCDVATQWAAILDPATGTTTALPYMALTHRGARVLPLLDGRVLVLDGAGIEVLDLQANAFTLVGTPAVQVSDAMVRADGKVLLKGNLSSDFYQFGVWDPATNQLQWDAGSFYLGTGLIQGLPDGKALVGDWVSEGTLLDPTTFKVLTSQDATLAASYRVPIAFAPLAGGQILALDGEISGPGPLDGQVTVKRFDPEASLTIAPAQSIQNVGLPVQLTLAGSAAAGGVTWSATSGTLTPAGLFTATQTGLVHVTATAASGPVAHAWITVVPAVGVTFPVLPFPNGARAYHAGMAWPLSATVLNHPNGAVTWSLQEGSAAGTITSGGVYTASTPGTYHVLATSVADPTKSATMTVTAQPPVALSLSPTTATLLPGQSATFTLTEPSGEIGVLWSATGGTVTPGPGSGTYVAPATPGVYTVTAVSTPDPTRQVTATVTVNAIDSLVLAPARPVMAPNDLLRIRAYARSGGALVDVTASVAWSATGGSFSNATYRSLYTAPSAPGTFTVTGTLPGTGISAASLVTVLPSEAFTTNGGGSSNVRAGASLTRLLDGRVLLAGGGTLTAELYDPANKTFRDLAAPMLKSRSNHTATLLPNGKVLLAGGASDNSNSAELFDPATETFTATAGAPSYARSGGLATLLPNGKVLLAAGTDGYGGKSMELYDPAMNAFVPAGALQSATPGASLLLADGRVLFSGSRVIANGDYAAAPSETYDFRTPGTVQVGASNTLHDYCSMIQSADGKVWRVGGMTPNTSNPSRVETFDLLTGQFTLGPLMLGPGRGATERVDGSVWFEGTATAVQYGESKGMRFDPATGACEAFRGATIGAPTVLLANGDILVAGSQSSAFLAEVIPGDPSPAMVVLPRRTVLVAGQSRPFQAAATGLGNTGFTWSVQEGVGSVSPQGVFTAPLTAGIYHVVATSTVNGSVSAVATVDVVADLEVSVSPALIQLRPGAVQRFSASVVGSSDPAVTWSASGGSIAADGTYTAPGAVGTYTVTAASAANPQATATATVVVSSTGGPIPVPKITSFTADATVVLAGAPVNLAWTVLGAYQLTLYGEGPGQDVTGLTGTAPRPTSTTQYQLSAANPAGGVFSAALTVNVVQGPVSISITPATAQLYVGQTAQFGFSLSPTTRKVWSASGGTITQGGLYTAPATPGTYTVTVTSVDDPSKSASSIVTVRDITLSLSPSYVQLDPGQAYRFNYAFDGGDPAQLVWSATGGTINNGLYTAPAQPGTYTVTFSYPPVNRASQATVVVKPVSIAITPASALLPTGGSLRFSAIASSGSVTWSVVEANGGVIDANGLYRAPLVTGTFTVKAQSTSNPAVMGTARVTVGTDHGGGGGGGSVTATGQGGVTITLSPAVALADAGTYFPYQADLSGTDNLAVTWTLVNNPPDASIDATGVFTSSRQGNYVVQVASVADPTAVVQATMVVSPSVKPLDTTNGPMSAMRGYSVTALQDGRVLIAGGCPLGQENAPSDQHGNVNFAYSAQAWIYDPTTQAFQATGSMITPRGFHQATLLDDGKVLISGGSTQWLDPWSPYANDPVQHGLPWARYSPFAELFDPTSGTFTALPMSQPHPAPAAGGVYANALQGPGMMWSNHSWGQALKLANGKVLILGGDFHGWWSSLVTGTLSGTRNEGVDLFDPATGTFDLSSSAPWRFTVGYPAGSGIFGVGTTPRMESLQDGRVLITVGHLTDEGNGTRPQDGTPILPVNQPVLLDPVTMQTTATGPMVLSRFGHTLTRLPDGRILAVGGKDYTQAQYRGAGSNAWNFKTTATAEIYDPATNQWTATGNLNSERAYHAALLLPTGEVLIIGGIQVDLNGNIIYPDAIEIFDPNTLSFSVSEYLPYGLIEPQIIMMSDDTLFVSGAIQPLANLNTNRNGDSGPNPRLGISNTSNLTTGERLLGSKKIKAGALIQKVIFTSGHPSLWNYNTDYGNVGGTQFNPNGWELNVANNPISHSAGKKVTAELEVRIWPAKKNFEISGQMENSSIRFRQVAGYPEEHISNGKSQIIHVESELPLDSIITIINEKITWTIKESPTGRELGSSKTGPHKMFVTIAEPINNNTANYLTLKRIEFACNAAMGKGTIKDIAISVRDYIAGNPPLSPGHPGYTLLPNQIQRFHSDHFWECLDDNGASDCSTLSGLATEVLRMLGVNAYDDNAYPTTDNPLLPTSCHDKCTSKFIYKGNLFDASLRYGGPGNHNRFEGYFFTTELINGINIITAYTVYMPGGPFMNQSYYAAEVMQSTWGTSPNTRTQYWRWEKNQESPDGTVQVFDDQDVPGASTIEFPSNIPNSLEVAMIPFSAIIQSASVEKIDTQLLRSVIMFKGKTPLVERMFEKHSPEKIKQSSNPDKMGNVIQWIQSITELRSKYITSLGSMRENQEILIAYLHSWRRLIDLYLQSDDVVVKNQILHYWDQNLIDHPITSIQIFALSGFTNEERGDARRIAFFTKHFWDLRNSEIAPIHSAICYTAFKQGGTNELIRLSNDVRTERSGKKQGELMIARNWLEYRLSTLSRKTEPQPPLPGVDADIFMQIESSMNKYRENKH